MTIIQGLWLCLCGLLSLQLFWAAFIASQWFRIRKDTSRKELISSGSSSAPVSIIIAARNEAENLLHYLPQWLDQLRPQDELVVVDDRSSDDTPMVLRAFSERHPAVKTVTANEPPGKGIFPGKKYAITLGVKAASHEHLLFTDADCWPAHSNWVETGAQLMERSQVALGCGFVKPERSFVSRLAHSDSLHTALLYQAFARAGKPYMGVGRSMAYHKTLFFKQGGFQAHQHIKSGDDDLFISGLTSVSAISRPGMLTWTPAPETLGDYFDQRTRHSTTSFHYRGIHKVLLGSYYVSLALFWPLVALSFFSGKFYLAAAFLSIRLALQACSFHLLVKTTNTSLSFLNYLWSELFLAVSYPLFTIGSRWSKSSRWKN